MEKASHVIIASLSISLHRAFSTSPPAGGFQSQAETVGTVGNAIESSEYTLLFALGQYEASGTLLPYVIKKRNASAQSNRRPFAGLSCAVQVTAVVSQFLVSELRMIQ